MLLISISYYRFKAFHAVILNIYGSKHFMLSLLSLKVHSISCCYSEYLRFKAFHAVIIKFEVSKHFIVLSQNESLKYVMLLFSIDTENLDCFRFENNG